MMRQRKPRELLIGGLPRPSGGVTVFLGRLVNAIGGDVDFHVLDIHQGEKEPTVAVRHDIAPHSRVLKNLWLFWKICTFSGDIIHFNHSRLSSLLFIYLMPKLGRQFFLTLHNGALFEDLPSTGLRRLLYLRAARKLDVVFALCTNHVDTFNALHVLETRIVRTKSHVPPVIPTVDMQDEKLDSLFESRSKVFVCSGHVDRIYNFEFAVKFLNDNATVGAAFFFYGRYMDQEYLDALEHQIVDKSQLLFFFHKSEAEFLSVLKKSDLFARPNLVDSWGISVADSIILGIPAVASDVCERYPGAVLFESGNYAAFRDSVASVLQGSNEQDEVKQEKAGAQEQFREAYCAVMEQA